METPYIPIKLEFTSKGFAFKQVLREGDLAIYEQRSLKYSHVAFEVIRIRRHNGYEIAGHKFPPAEMYPSNTQWGRLGWTCSTLEDAQRKLAWAKKEFEQSPEPEVVDTTELVEGELPEADEAESPAPAAEQAPKQKGRPRKEKPSNQGVFEEILNPKETP